MSATQDCSLKKWKKGGQQMNLDAYEWTCSCCGKEMTGLPLALAFQVPTHWLRISPAEMEASRISDDFCLIHETNGEPARYIRCVLPMPLSGFDELEFGFGVWMSVSKRSWDIYERGFETGCYAEDGCFGYLGNSISLYPGSLHLSCDVVFQPDNQRPRVQIHTCDNQLAIDQVDGMKIEVIEALLANSQH